MIIEAKLTEDDGTARDKKSSRVLRSRALEDVKPANSRCQVVAVIDGRGFMERMEDMLLLMRATEGHVYTLAELEMLVAPGGPLEPFVTRRPESASPSL